MSLHRECFRHLRGIERKRIPQTPAGDLRLHRLERPEPWSADLMQAIWEAQKGVQQYPDYVPFYERLAQFAGRPKEQIVVGQGIEGLIRDLVMLCCDPGDVVAFTWPTCAMFDIYADVFGAKAAHIIASPDDDFTPEDLLRQLSDKTRLLILPNPGQPVETCFWLHEMRLIAERCWDIGAVLAVDEAYYGFGAPSVLSLTDEFENVLVLRTFSKAFGAAGIRVGFAIGQDAVIKPLDAVRASGEIAGPSLTAATVLMDRWVQDVDPAIAGICAGRDWVLQRLWADGYKVTGEYANHVLIEVNDAVGVAARLKGNGVHVKAGFPAPVDRHLLVTCGTVETMQRFHSAFCEAV